MAYGSVKVDSIVTSTQTVIVDDFVTPTSTNTLTNKTLTSPTLTAPALGTPASGTLTNCTFPTLNQSTTGNAATVTTNANLTGHITSVGNAAVLGSFTSAQLATALTDETGTGASVFATSPTLVTPALGAATATSIVVGSGVTINASGIITAGLDLSSLLREGVEIVAGKLSDNLNINLEYGMVFLFTTTETTTSTPNIRYNSSISLNSVMNIGEAISVTLITTAAAAAYSAQLTIDGNAVTEYWIGGSAPSSGGSYGYDLHTYTIIKTASATFAVLANRSKTST